MPNPFLPEDWEAIRSRLPPEILERVNGWVSTQQFVAQELGVAWDEWYQYLQWAFQNPLDFSFADEGIASVPGGSDGIDEGAGSQRAADVVGTKRETKLPGSGGLGNLFAMVAEGSKERREAEAKDSKKKK